MPIWSEILSELAGHDCPEYNKVRKNYLTKLYNKTKRPVILYATAWLQNPNYQPNLLSINDEDIQAFKEVVYGIEGTNLDLILHSPGGSVEATESIVSYLRSRFSNIRVIVPQLAMSTATLLSCSANSIVLGKHSSLGPTDPQLLLPTSFGTRQVAAKAVIGQFEIAKQECTDPVKLSVWLPMISQYGPDLLIRCESALEMTRLLARTWLESYMFDGKENALKKAKEISGWLADHESFKSHSRHISRKQIEERGLIVEHLEKDQEFQDLVLSVLHSTTLTFSGTRTAKIVENHLGELS